MFDPLQTKDKLKDKVELNVKQEAQHLLLYQSIRPHKGHCLWELHIPTGMIREVTNEDYEKTDVNWFEVVDELGRFRPDYTIKRTLIRRENCVYITSLNQRNAVKHFKKQGFL